MWEVHSREGEVSWSEIIKQEGQPCDNRSKKYQRPDPADTLGKDLVLSLCASDGLDAQWWKETNQADYSIINKVTRP